MGNAGGIEWPEDRVGLLGCGGDPATDGRVIRGVICGQQGLQDRLDLPEADAGGEGDGGDLVEFGGIAEDGMLDSSLGLVELLTEGLILGLELVKFRLASRRVESLFDLAGMLVDRLAATSGLLSLAGDGAEDLREDGGGVANAGADG